LMTTHMTEGQELGVPPNVIDDPLPPYPPAP
jgi:hypothetical protein